MSEVCRDCEARVPELFAPFDKGETYLCEACCQEAELFLDEESDG